MKLAQAFADCALDEIMTALDGGTLIIYSVARPSSPDKPVERSEVLATFFFQSPAFSYDAVPIFIANPVIATGVGTPGFARALKADGSTVADFSAGPGKTEIKLNEIAAITNYPIALTAMTLALPMD